MRLRTQDSQNAIWRSENGRPIVHGDQDRSTSANIGTIGRPGWIEVQPLTRQRMARGTPVPLKRKIARIQGATSGLHLLFSFGMSLRGILGSNVPQSGSALRQRVVRQASGSARSARKTRGPDSCTHITTPTNHRGGYALAPHMRTHARTPYTSACDRTVARS